MPIALALAGVREREDPFESLSEWLGQPVVELQLHR
jgi:hypothetical protein